MSKVPISIFKEKNSLIFTSGQIHLKNGALVEGNVSELTHQVMEKLAEVLSSAETSFKNVLKTTIYVTDMSIYMQSLMKFMLLILMTHFLQEK